MTDVVNHPKHYADTCSLECIDVMETAFGEEAVIHFCLCNAFKYMWRYKNKNGNEDLDKAQWYIDRCEDMVTTGSQLHDLWERLSILLNKYKDKEGV